MIHLRNHWPLAAAAALLLASCGGLNAQTDRSTPTEVAVSSSSAGRIRTEVYADVLSDYVHPESTFVDYEALQANRAQLDTYIDDLAALDEATYESWSEAEQIAYWVNAYNAITLKSIIDQTPIKPSIKDIIGVWRIRRHAIFGGNKTLNNIEHDVLRVDFDEPRIHAALVCAAVSCPPLRTEPFTGENLDAQLDDQVEQWLAKEDGLRIDREEGVVYLSKIFDWFTVDWVPSYGLDEGDNRFTGNDKERAVLNFVAGYVNESDREFLEAGDYRIQYFDYDWSLNIQS
ncbi:DUF547 domain-containing protein [Synechococcus sp. PCC 7336]|uniref:DUF547 domain-containing protein n=1 Tax=Synechococcus sp. PCC 7336 TaxID=195250 RepID=UPI000345B556|nr:DUF547 domain-containing protein [Synechococcus sp. PCC 7336]